MNLSPALQQEIEQIAATQGISPEQFIVQALVEKISSLKQLDPISSKSQTGLKNKDGIPVFETESLDHIDFNSLIAQSREEQMMK